MGPNKTLKGTSDRGRYPEEAATEDEAQREDTPSDDGDGDVKAAEVVSVLNFKAPAGPSEPINISKPVTPVYGATDMDETNFSFFDGLGGNAMDVDVVRDPRNLFCGYRLCLWSTYGEFAL